MLVAEVVKDTDLRRLLSVIDASRSAEAAEGLPATILERARDLVPCDSISLVELDPHGSPPPSASLCPKTTRKTTRKTTGCSGSTTGTACRAATPTAAATCSASP